MFKSNVILYQIFPDWALLKEFVKYA